MQVLTNICSDDFSHSRGFYKLITVGDVQVRVRPEMVA